MRRRELVVPGLVALALTVMAACGGGDDATTAADATGEATVGVGSTTLGPVLVDADGMTLYLFTPDGAGASTCTGQCAELWPPLIVDGDPVAGDGLDHSLLGTVERDDGSSQATYGGHPLYGYAPDQEVGDVTGQGVGGIWFVVSPEGEAVEEAAAPRPAPTGSVGY